MPEIAFHGAAGTVTGSRYLVTSRDAKAGDERVLVDCGMYQGLKELRLKNWEPMPFDAAAPASAQALAATIQSKLGWTVRVPKRGRWPMRRASASIPRKRILAMVCPVLAAVSVGVLGSTSVQGMAVTSTGEVRQPRNIYELVYGFQFTFANILTPDELRLFLTLSPGEIKAKNPDLYSRIAQDVKGWTDEWVLHVRSSPDSIPQKRLEDARQLARQVDAVLKTHFESKRWPYRSIRVEFLPPRVFLDERHRENITSGMFIPFYPEAFFATVDWTASVKLVLVHETLHYNKTGSDYGRAMLEGITEVAARYLALKYGLLTAHEIAKEGAYPSEQKGVELVLSEIMKRSGGSRDDALDLLLAAYLTGNQEGMGKVFGAAPWAAVIELGQSDEGWQTHRISKALAKTGDPGGSQQ